MERQHHLRAVCAISAILLIAACSPAASTPPTVPGASEGAVVSGEPSSPEASATPSPTALATPASPGGTSSAASPAASATLSPAPTPTATRWVSAGAYGDRAMADLAAARLGSGRVLFLGTGVDPATDETTVPFASVWDASTGVADPAPALPKVRTQAVIVPLRDGSVLVAGGLNEPKRYSTTAQSYSSAYVFREADGGSWTKVGLMHQARSSACAAVLGDGRVLVVGGYFYTAPSYGSADPGVRLAAARLPSLAPEAIPADVEPPNIGAALATAELYDPVSGTWSTTGPMHYARTDCAATTLTDGRVLVVGSSSGGGVRVPSQALDTAEVFDPATRTFALTGRLPRPDQARYGDLHDLWPAGIDGHSPGQLWPLGDGGALLVGDSTSFKHEGSMSRTFRWAAGTWTDVGPTYAYYGDPGGTPKIRTPGARDLSSATSVALTDGRVLAAGGLVNQGAGWGTPSMVATVQAWDVTKRGWSTLPALPAPRQWAVAVVLADGSVILAGGSSPSSEGEDTVTTVVRLGVGQ